MSLWNKIKDLFSKKPKQNLLPEGDHENATIVENGNFKKQLQESAKKGLTQEQLKRKFITEELGLDEKFSKNPVIYDEILIFFNKYIGKYSDVSLEKFDEYKKGIQLLKLDDENISLETDDGIGNNQSLLVNLKKRGFIETIYKENTKKRSMFNKYGETPKYNKLEESIVKLFDFATYIEMQRLHNINVRDDNDKVIETVLDDFFIRDTNNLEYVFRNEEKNPIDISRAVASDIATLDGAANDYKTTELAQKSFNSIYGVDDENKRKAHQDNLRRKIAQSKYKDGFYKYKQYKDLNNEQIIE